MMVTSADGDVHEECGEAGRIRRNNGIGRGRQASESARELRAVESVIQCDLSSLLGIAAEIGRWTRAKRGKQGVRAWNQSGASSWGRILRARCLAARSVAFLQRAGAKGKPPVSAWRLDRPSRGICTAWSGAGAHGTQASARPRLVPRAMSQSSARPSARRRADSSRRNCRSGGWQRGHQWRSGMRQSALGRRLRQSQPRLRTNQP